MSKFSLLFLLFLLTSCATQQKPESEHQNEFIGVNTIPPSSQMNNPMVSSKLYSGAQFPEQNKLTFQQLESHS